MRSILASLLVLLGALICSVRAAEDTQSFSVYRQLED